MHHWEAVVLRAGEGWGFGEGCLRTGCEEGACWASDEGMGETLMGASRCEEGEEGWGTEASTVEDEGEDEGSGCEDWTGPECVDGSGACCDVTSIGGSLVAVVAGTGWTVA